MKDNSFDVVGLLPALLRYARALVHDPSEAEELVHETLVRAYERRITFDDRRALRPWLFSILHNRFVDGYRRRQMEERAVESLAAAPETVTPLVDADTRVQLSQIHQAFTRLPEAQRAALHLVAVEGLSYQEAADALGIPVGTLMSRLSRARTALRQLDQPSAPEAHAPNRAPSFPPVSLKLVRRSHGKE
ncbi:sigma-70 family RNA polymerase sigma factor [Pedomonas mirosovicensis]|uniref:sigma-70 family RNA polymerase sigma factor n=1 Tax=Pedomonas mirosovicensis TaxID=2908641 RepID=UPI0021672940|nr:sigma-70 family RNA polymerase sigma factor [Pedomonas mirosovicensis]MCH8685417.1 sigma-70 family RNA polymerase sigma factor [Pedomonas mirosovicensis]